MLDYLQADVMALMDHEALSKIITGEVGVIRMTPRFLLGAPVLMETAIAMVLLARLLPYQANRWADIAGGVLHTAAVSMALQAVTPTLYGLFSAVIETGCTLRIVWFATRWKEGPAASAGRAGMAAASGEYR